MFKKILSMTIYFILGFAALLLLYFLSAFIFSRIAVNQKVNNVEDLDIYLLTNGIHSDIVVPTKNDQIDWFEKINHLKPSFDISDYRYLALGWGDKGFYLETPSWSELKVSTALKATVGLSGTAMHATYYKDMVESESCVKISISKTQYSKLIKYIERSFEVDQNQNYLKIETDNTKSETDGFYDATGRYSIFNTCNNWTNKGLKFSDQKACLWTVFQKPIFLKYRD